MSNSPLELHSVDFGIFGASQTPSLVSAPKIPKTNESQTENPSVVDSTQSVESSARKIVILSVAKNPNQTKSARSANPCPTRHTEATKSPKYPLKSFCFVWLSPKVESHLLLNFNLANKADSTNPTQQTIEGIAVEVVGFLGDFGCETGYKSAKHSKSPKSPQDARISKLQQDTLTKGNGA